jgi:hypothetical protein
MGPDKKTVCILAAAMILLAGLGYVMVAAYASHFTREAEAAYGGDESNTPPGPAGAPTREQVARLHDALRRQFGTNARGLERVTHLDYDGWPDRMHLVLALDHNPLTMTPAQASELRPLLDVLRALHAAGLHWGCVLVSATAPAQAEPGRVTEATVVRMSITREKLDRLDWRNATTDDLVAAADQFSVDDALAQVRRAMPEKPAAARPTTRPATTAPAATALPGPGTRGE